MVSSVTELCCIVQVHPPLTGRSPEENSLFAGGSIKAGPSTDAS